MNHIWKISSTHYTKNSTGAKFSFGHLLLCHSYSLILGSVCVCVFFFVDVCVSVCKHAYVCVYPCKRASVCAFVWSLKR